MKKTGLKFTALFVVLFFFVQMVIVPEVLALGSGGFSNQVVGLRALGKGNSAVASPEDASTVYMNPAGMPFLKGMQSEKGITFEVLQFEHKNPAGNETRGEKSLIKVPHGFFTTGNAINDRFSLGLGMSAPYGLQTEWDDQSFARFVATESELVIIDYNASLAYKVTDNFAIAGGMSFYDSSVALNKKVNVTAVNFSLNSSVTPNVIGSQQLKGDDTALGYNLALFYQPNENHRMGATFRSKAEFRYKGRISLAGLTGISSTTFGGSHYETRLESKLTLPESFEVGYAYTPDSKKWTWEVDGAWTGWDSVERARYDWPEESSAARLAILNVDNPFPRDWRSTYSVGTGYEYRAKDWLKLRTGYLFYQTPVPGDHFEPSLPDTNRHFFTGGFGIEKGNFRADAAYALVIAPKRSIDNTVGNSSDTNAIDGTVSSIDGDFGSLNHLFGVNISWAF